jgi:hypothetical protein
LGPRLVPVGVRAWSLFGSEPGACLGTSLEPVWVRVWSLRWEAARRTAQDGASQMSTNTSGYIKSFGDPHLVTPPAGNK